MVTLILLVCALALLAGKAWYEADARALQAPRATWGDAQAWVDQLDAELDALSVDAAWSETHATLTRGMALLRMAEIDRKRALRSALDYAHGMRPRMVTTLSDMCVC